MILSMYIPKIAYFSAEVGIRSDIKTYSGGLGILAGDTIKAAADLELPFCAVTLLYKKGFLKQKIVDNRQTEEDDPWDFMSSLEFTGKHTKIHISGEEVLVKIWKYEYEGITGHKVPIFFLDTDLNENPKWAQEITNRLYQGDRLAQEMVLGIGGIRALWELGYEESIEKYHMNEGHSCFLTLELYRKLGEEKGWDDGHVRDMCVFTTHTPIPAGHDKFDYSEISDKFRGEEKLLPWHLKRLAGESQFNTTLLAMSLSSYINAVSEKHKFVTREMFPTHTIHHITNGVHLSSWVSPHMAELYDKHITGWRENNELLQNIFLVENNELLEAHQKSKKDLVEMVNKKNVTGAVLDEDTLTLGFARRFIQYKDAELIFQNITLLKQLGKKVQFVFAGKSHTRDEIGKDIMKRIIRHAKELKDSVSIAFIEDYNIGITSKMISGCDMWLNTPIPPNEASGTSGMKATANGCLHFSRLDGWALEGFERNGGGFPICEYKDMMALLQYKIIPMFYSGNKESWAEQMKLSIGNSASYFNTHRMMKEYVRKSYKMDLP